MVICFIMMQMIKTTLVLPEDQLRQAKIKAIEEKTTVSKYVSQLLREKLQSPPSLHQKDLDPMKTLGKLKLGRTSETYRRSEMYEEYLKRKMGY